MRFLKLSVTGGVISDVMKTLLLTLSLAAAGVTSAHAQFYRPVVDVRCAPAPVEVVRVAPAPRVVYVNRSEPYCAPRYVAHPQVVVVRPAPRHRETIVYARPRGWRP